MPVFCTIWDFIKIIIARCIVPYYAHHSRGHGHVRGLCLTTCSSSFLPSTDS